MSTQQLRALLSRLAHARTVTDINIAAGTLLSELEAEEEEEELAA